jgi:DNA polymerase I-like protein with 3'-5' exonuclease and polymerase domains
MLFPHGTVGFYLDWRAQEVGIGAAQSGDLALQAAYQGDIYHALAVLSGETTDMDIIRWKREHPEVRQRMKPLQLGINYLMGVPSLARGLNCHPYIASYILDRYGRTYPRFIEWRTETVHGAMLDRKIESVFGWPLYLTVAPNMKTLANFKLQANGAEMLRIAVMRLCDAGIVPIMLVHDGILFEETDERQIEHAKEIMRQAGRDVCGGFELGVDLDQRLSGDKRRYRDKRPIAIEMWATLTRTLQSVGVTLPEVAA